MYNSLLHQNPNGRVSLSGYDLVSDTAHLSATSCESILVCTGVYDPDKQVVDDQQPWKVPTTIQGDILKAVKYILLKEHKLDRDEDDNAH